MRPATYEEVEKLIKARAGVPAYWAGVFVKARLSLRAVEVYLETSEGDATSPLRLGKGEFLGRELEDLQTAYGLEVDGGAVKYDEVIRYLASTVEQDAVIREVSRYATVKFKPAKTSTYCAHVVARSIRMINGKYLYRLVPPGSRVLEAGADLKTLPFRPLDFCRYRAANPVMGVRDVVRHSYEATCRRTLAAGRADPRVLERARFMLDHPDQVFEPFLVQDSKFRADVILTNDASHDIPFADMPKVMASRGAVMWFGAMMRVKGLSRHSTHKSGDIPVLGARYRIDYAHDKISFHFKGDASFDYTHRLSEHRRYEEHTDYVFRGGQYDYIYTKLPATTDTTLFFCVYRVAAAPFSVSEPTFAPSGSAGKVKIKSVKAVGDDRSGLPRAYEPYEFEMDEEIYEKVAERRHSMGVRGNLSVTISFLRSVRVRFYINGESIGAEGRMGQELLESAAVAVEVIVAENRRMVDTTLSMVDASHKAALTSVLTQACDHRYLTGRIADYFGAVWADVRSRLVQAALEPSQRLVVEVVRMPAYVRVDQESTRMNMPVVQDGTAACLCVDKSDARAALQFGDLSFSQRRQLQSYLRHLDTLCCKVCLHPDDVVNNAADKDEADEAEFFDAESTLASDGSGGFDKPDDDTFTDATSSFGETVGTVVEEAVDEYVSLQRYISRAVKSKVRRDASILFKTGVPSEVTLTQYSVGRIKHYAVEIRSGELVRIVGGGRIVDLSACYSADLMQLMHVQRKSGKCYVHSDFSGWIYSCSSLEIFNNDALASAVECVKQDPVGLFDPAKATFVQGVPGSGKTYEIVQQMCARVGHASVLYLSATVASADDVRRRVYGRSSEGIKRVRTLDSFMLGSVLKADEVWVDEAPMAHAGQLFAALHKCMAVKVKFYGDFEQIPYCSFTSETEFKVSFASLRGLMPVQNRAVTHRCPPDVCRMWRDRYSDGFDVCQCHADDRPERSVRVERISSASQIVYSGDVRYMVYTQQEKRDLHQMLGFDASIEVVRLRTSSGLATVHEDQGSTHDNVALVRLVARYDMKESPLAPSIYNKLEYALTASTRHKRSFVYYTTSVEQDVMVKRVLSVQ